MKPKRKKKKSPQDLTIRNARHYNRKLKDLHNFTIRLFDELCLQRGYTRTLVDILKSKRLLTPAQISMLEASLK